MSLLSPKTMPRSAAPRGCCDEEMKRSKYFRHFDYKPELNEGLQRGWSSGRKQVDLEPLKLKIR